MLPKVSLGTNKNMTKVVASIKEDSNVKYYPSFERDLINFIQKKLLKANILIGIRDYIMLREINKVTSILRIKEIIDKAFTFVVVTGVDPVVAVDDNMIFYYKSKLKNSEKNKDDKVNYSNRGFVQGVTEGEVIIEYIKPKTGIAGRNVKGDVISVNEPKILIKEKINVSQNIDVKEDDDSIKYIAKKNGYVNEEKGTYDIKDELDINEVSFKTTGSIETSLESDVKINIKEKDILKDAVGAGMSIETTSINVEGNVAKGAHIVAKDVIIGGQTHAKSVIKAQTAEISVHLGRLICDEAKIDRLESGYVRAKKVFINSVIGGEIIANEVHIKRLFANSSITASTLVEIDELKGTNNRICIDSGEILNYEGKLEEYSKTMSKLKTDILVIPRELESKKNIIDSNRESVNSIKRRIEELRSTGKAPPMSFLNKLKDFQALVYEYNSMLKDLNGKKAALNDLKEELKSMQSMVFKAKIINKDRWKELNEIKFRLIEPKKDITYSTRENELAKLITLKCVTLGDEEIYEIKKSNEI
ncbi:FapA family protein [Campylobacter fetus subsp. fetus]|nr:FapA family protein [Campylobacter fetus subsp. fetus]